MRSHLLVSTAVCALVASVSLADTPLKSGPQVGKAPGTFNPLHATGPDEGKKNCLI